jgi:hypothetical protein
VARNSHARTGQRLGARRWGSRSRTDRFKVENVYPYSETPQNLATLLDKALRDGRVRVERRDGQAFGLKPQPRPHSPLDVERVDLNVSASEIVGFIREGRRTYDAETRVTGSMLLWRFFPAGSSYRENWASRPGRRTLRTGLSSQRC